MLENVIASHARWLQYMHTQMHTYTRCEAEMMAYSFTDTCILSDYEEEPLNEEKIKSCASA